MVCRRITSWLTKLLVKRSTLMSITTATFATFNNSLTSAKEKEASAMADDWIIPDKKQFLELRNTNSGAYVSLTYRNKNPDANLQIAEAIENGMVLVVHFHSRYSESEIKRISNKFRVTLSGDQWNTKTGEPRHQYMSIPIGSIRLETFLPIEQFLISKGCPIDLLKELKAQSCFKRVSAEEEKFYSTVASIGQKLDENSFRQLFIFANTFLSYPNTDSRFSISVCSDLLYCLGNKCFQSNLFEFSYEALKAITKDSAYYYAAQLLMGQCLWSRYGADNSGTARKMKKQAFTHFYFASLEIEEAEGFIQMALANLCDMTTYDPLIQLMSATTQAADDPVRTIIEKFLHLTDVCYNQSKIIQRQKNIIDQLKISSNSNNDDPSVHALTIQFNTMVSEVADEDIKDPLKHKKRAIKKDEKEPESSSSNIGETITSAFALSTAASVPSNSVASTATTATTTLGCNKPNNRRTSKFDE